MNCSTKNVSIAGVAMVAVLYAGYYWWNKKEKD